MRPDDITLALWVALGCLLALLLMSAAAVRADTRRASLPGSFAGLLDGREIFRCRAAPLAAGDVVSFRVSESLRGEFRLRWTREEGHTLELLLIAPHGATLVRGDTRRVQATIHGRYISIVYTERNEQ